MKGLNRGISRWTTPSRPNKPAAVASSSKLAGSGVGLGTALPFVGITPLAGVSRPDPV